MNACMYLRKPSRKPQRPPCGNTHLIGVESIHGFNKLPRLATSFLPLLYDWKTHSWRVKDEFLDAKDKELMQSHPVSPALFFHSCVWMFCLQACQCAICILGTHGDEKRASDPWVTNGGELACGCWELNPGLLEEQWVLFTTESSLQSSSPYFTPSWLLLSCCLGLGVFRTAIISPLCDFFSKLKRTCVKIPCECGLCLRAGRGSQVSVKMCSNRLSPSDLSLVW